MTALYSYFYCLVKFITFVKKILFYDRSRNSVSIFYKIQDILTGNFTSAKKFESL